MIPDNDIKKALERCKNVVMHDCKNCFYNKEYNAKCVVMLVRDALDLINRKDAEIERLKAENEVMKTNCNSMYVSMPNMAKAERTEAIKEFAERFKKKYEKPFFYLGSYEQFMREVDNLVKEMTEQ